MHFGILGALVVRTEGGDVAVSGAKRRALLTRLVLDANRCVSSGQLVEDLWTDKAASSANQTLQSHISQVRRLLGADRIVTDPGGYRLVATTDEVDALAFEAQVAEGRKALRAGDHLGAADFLVAALGRWRGRALAEVADQPWAVPAAGHLEELRLAATEALVDARLALGQVDEALTLAERALAESPLRERLWAQVMIALFRSGRQADALAAYQRARRLLAEELGLEPGAELRELEGAILRQDPALGRPSSPAAPATPGLPSGVVTFLLTDIVGSTRLWETAPEAMARAQSRHDELIREAVAGHAGVVLKARGEGDSTFSVFRRATDAALAALDARARLAAEVWPEDCPIAVRMALHTGEALEVEGDYYGPTVNRVARLRAVGEPAQILVSHATADVVVDHLPPSAELLELGPQDLRDLARPETVYVLSDRIDQAGSQPGSGDTEAASPDLTWARLPPGLRPSPLPFAGRLAESEVLASSLASAAGTWGRIVLVSGDPGIGKTRLCSEFASTALASGALVAYGRSDPDGGLPYQPFVQALGGLVEEVPQNMLEQYARTFGGELVRLTPALARRVRSLRPPQPAAPDTERHLLFDAVRGLLQHVGANGPIVLVLDDLHWADRPTLQLVRYLADEVAVLPLLLIGTFREGELDEGVPLVDLLSRLRRVDTVDHLRLEGLAVTQLAELVDALAGTDSGGEDDLARRLGEETGGNPLFTVELLRHLVEIDAVGPARPGSELAPLEMPETVRDVVSQRVLRLGAGPSRVLTLASVIGLEFDLALLAAALDEDDGEVLAHLEMASAAHLVVEAGTPGRFAFSHAVIAHTLEQTLTSTRRARDHLRVAQAIEQVHGDGGGPHLPDLAAHLAAAGPLADPVRAGETARRAGDQAMAQLAPDEAVRWYRAALDQTVGDEARCDVLIPLGTAQQQAGIPAFRDTLLEAAQLAMALGDDVRLVAAAIANNRGSRARTFFVDRERVEVLEAAVATAHGQDSPPIARALALLAAETMHDDDWALRLRRSDAAVDMARRLGDPATLADVLRLRFETTHLPETLALRLQDTAEQVALAEQLGDPLRLAYAYLWRGRVGIEVGDLEGLDRDTARAWELAGKVRDPFLLWNLSVHRCTRAFIAGDLEGAERKAFECFAVADEAGQPDGRNVLGDQLLVIRDAQGRLAEMEPVMRRTVERYPHVRSMRAVLAYLSSELDQPDEASELLDEDADDGFSRFTRDMVWLASISYAARAATNVHHTMAASRLFDILSAWPNQVVWSGSHPHGPVSLLLGGLALTLGQPAQALDFLHDANAMSRGMEAPVWLARGRVGEARALLARGGRRDGAAAGAALGEAFELARRHGLGSVERQCVALQDGEGPPS